MKHLIKIAAISVLFLSISLSVFADFYSYPIYEGDLSEVSYRAIAEAEDVYIVEINGKIYRVPKVK